MKKTLLDTARLLVGILFIFSGLIKANDPLGLAYKMDEYFNVWHMDWASAYSLVLSITMNVFEIVAGVALLLGYQAKLITWLLLLLIIFFTFLTGYAVLSGKIKTCGCFGDCIPLQAYQSFIKDLILLALIVFLFIKRDFIRPILSKQVSIFIILFCTGFVAFGQLNVLKVLPYVDCLPYAKGKNLLQEMQPPPGSVPDSSVTMFRYTKNGTEVKFDANNFPADFNDSLYHYAGRETVVVRQGTPPKIQDLAFYASSGTDTTKEILSYAGNYLLFFVKDFDGMKPAWLDQFSAIYLSARNHRVPLYLVSNQPVKTGNWFNQTNHFNIPVLTCDGTVMKTFLRSKTGVVAMKGATVINKWPGSKLEDVLPYLEEDLK